MKKILIVMVLTFGLLALLGVGIAAARTVEQVYDPERGTGLLHDYIVAAFAGKLDLSVDTVNAELLAGKTLYQIALENGVPAEEIPTLLQEVHETALAQAVADGVISQERADWMLEHMRGINASGNRYGDGSYCDGSGHGRMGGRGGR